MMRKIIILFLLLSTLIVNAQEDKTVTLTVSGTGITLEEAKTNALRSAIEQAFGAFISSKSEILNDQIVDDQISSVSSGNIQSFNILSEIQLPDGSWYNTLKVIVSIDKLTSFVQSKGVNIEIKGKLFALNVKQQLLNEQGELNVISEMIGVLHKQMQTSFDYSIKSETPKSVDAESRNWKIPLIITAETNKNMDFCANYFINIISSLSLDSNELESYKILNKQVFPISINYKNEANTFYLRNNTSLSIIKSFASNWEFYTRLFNVKSEINETFGQGKGEYHRFMDNIIPINEKVFMLRINFLTKKNIAATFSYTDDRTLSEIEQINGYSIKPRGLVSDFKYGGYVVYEKDGHGLIASIYDFGGTWFEANTMCNELTLYNFKDWRLPSKNELLLIYKNLILEKIGNFNIPYDGRGYTLYWSNEVEKSYSEEFAWCLWLEDTELSRMINKEWINSARAVRSF